MSSRSTIADPKGISARTFVCPLCGASNFTTDYHPPFDGSTDEGRCKGHESRDYGMRSYTGCSFRWLRRDDATVFVALDGATPGGGKGS